MSTTNNTIKRPCNSKIFSETTTLDEKTEKFVVKEVMRMLFFSRIAQLDLVATGRMDCLRPEFRQLIHNTCHQIRQLDMKTQAMLPKEDATWLRQELSSDRLANLAILIELVSRIDAATGEQGYNQFLTLLTTFLERAMNADLTLQSINLDKYAAIFKFLTDEVLAEAAGKPTAVHFDKTTNSLSFNLASPGAQL